MNRIDIVGLGASGLDELSLGVYKQLKQTNRLFLRTMEHPVIKQLEEEGVTYHSFDDIYEKHETFAAVYEEITEYLLKEAGKESLVYAVPGHPLVAEETVQQLLAKGPAKGIEVSIGGGQSFLDSLFTAVQVDPIEGFLLLDGTSLKKSDIHIHQHLILAQVYDAIVASDVKLILMEKYPDDYPVFVVTNAGSTREKVRKVLLYELDREAALDNLTSVYVPPVRKRELAYKEFTTLRDVIAELRGPEGCPWDKKQTHESLKKYLIEEAYELLDAIDRDDIDNMIEELGDVLLQVMLHSQIGEDEGMFSIEDVIESISRKMVRRHPHVFGNVTVANEDGAMKNWEQMKAMEKDYEEKASLLDKTEKGLPALMRAYDYQKKAAQVGFDWDEPAEALEKVKEELQEFEEELAGGTQRNQRMELGDLLFAIINAARLAGIHPEEALQATNEKFYSRFTFVESKVRESGGSFEDFTLESLDQFWNEAKKNENT